MRRLVLWLIVFPLDPYPPNVAGHDRMSFSEYQQSDVPTAKRCESATAA
jgi:hypothetical protein